MPYSFVQVEKEKTRSITLLKACLIALYFFTIWALFFSIKFWLKSQVVTEQFIGAVFLTGKENLAVLVISLLMGILHFGISTNHMIENTLAVLNAKPLDPHYSKHHIVQNIIDEVSLAMAKKGISGCVINSSACNAFSISDFDGRAYIGVTEGLLTKLNRSQLETVIGHEAGHIAREDALTVTVTCSLFGIYEGLLKGVKEGFSRTRGQLAVLVAIFYLVIQLTHFLNKLVSSFISQEKEFRADAVAVKLTRNPLALAQSLYIISKRWHGESTNIEGLSSLFIVDTASSFSGFTSHPPIEERINILLNMAHADKSALEALTENIKPQIKASQDNSRAKERKAKDLKGQQGWFAYKDGRWRGPYLFGELAALSWLTPEVFIRRDGAIEVKPAYQDNRLLSLFKPPAECLLSQYSCPHCYHGLGEINYEGAAAYKCYVCKGLLATREELNKILIREDKRFSQETSALAEEILKERKERFKKIQEIKTPWVINCPGCARKMKRRLFSHQAPVEIDDCGWCGRLWFDSEELEIIQAIYDKLPYKDQLIY